MTDRRPLVPTEILPPLPAAAGAPAKAPKQRSTLARLSPKMQSALENMIWEGKSRKEAAALAGVSLSGLGKLLKRPVAQSFYLEQCELLRLSGKASRIHKLEQIANEGKNANAQVNAIRTLESMEPAEGVARTRPGVHQPGIVIVIGTAPIGPRVIPDA